MVSSEHIERRAVELGFDAVATVAARRLVRGEAYLEWLREGRHGEMGYMENYQDLRVDPRALEPGTKSVVVVLKNYHQGEDKLAGGLRIARYAHGNDYHEVLRARLVELAAFIHAETGADVATRPAIDTAPLLERDLAAMAGLGWVGKNAMLIHPQIGSYTFIGEVLVDLELEAEPTVVLDRCGTCSRCMDACPTGAIVSPYVIDARRCISYLTIELRGPIPRELRALIGDHVFGCDICQSVCPWNSKAPRSEDPALALRSEYEALSALDLLELDDAAYAKTFQKSAIKRAKRRGLLRNAAVVVGNSRAPEAVARLALRLGAEAEPLVRGHIAWALGHIGGEEARLALEAAIEQEQDPYVLEELRCSLGL
ncbi:MAG: tRNA epoxyqueuosine(34) reductase QueG [Bradymonadaceae bacterium]|nr:tRNA epoxyqueuosine(34) reductase QueG [Lujinxingiaceae bacterium]